MDWTTTLMGFAVGTMIGLTGIGGGAVLTPMLILVGGVRPMIAVGTDLAYGAITKLVGSCVHLRQRTVVSPVVAFLALGSVPASLLGVWLLSWMRHRAGEAWVDQFTSNALGIVLLIVASSLLIKSGTPDTAPEDGPRDSGQESTSKRVLLTVLLGAGVGFVVSLTSVGSGSLILAGLVLLYPRLPLGAVVRTDILHSAILVSTAALGHLGMGGVDPDLLKSLLLGSIPGVVLGSKLSASCPERLLRPIVAFALAGAGFKLL
jgi:hypothetical protein